MNLISYNNFSPSGLKHECHNWCGEDTTPYKSMHSHAGAWERDIQKNLNVVPELKITDQIYQ